MPPKYHKTANFFKSAMIFLFRQKNFLNIILKQTHQKNEKNKENERYVNAKLKKSKKFQKRY